ncbi:MAG TPA: FtsX-like permease family protein [Blastocatellia bacterium]|jgi:lipoprotein-releasing system permease protein|nr:FtsX-like permease family protein [Blastocatellia bacterium]
MPYELFIALRYLKAKRKQVVISIITLIAIGAVAAGVASLVVVLAMMTGFREEFQTKILSGTAHLNLMRADGRPIENYRELIERLEKLPHVHSPSATLYNRVLIQGKADTDGAILKGADLSVPGDTSEILQFTVQGEPRSLAEPEIDPESGIKIDRIILGSELAQTLGLQIGDVATIISPKGHLTPLGMSPNYKDFLVAGIFKSGLRDYDATWAYISLEAAQRLSGAKDVAEVIQMKVDDIDRVKQIGRDVLAAAGEGFAVQDWQELNAPIYTALSYEKFFSGGALMIVIGIAALNIITILVMIVMEKQRDIAILKSMGATSRSIMYVFMIQGLVIGVIGMIAGIAIGGGFCSFAQGRQLIKLPAGAYALDYLPFHSHPTDILAVAAITIAISFLSTLYPSWSASRLDPVEGLRYE